MLEKEREPLLRDTLQRWSNHKEMVWRLSRLKTAWKKRRNGLSVPAFKQRRKVFWKTVIGLHDKHLGYITKYFKNNILFREACVNEPVYLTSMLQHQFDFQQITRLKSDFLSNTRFWFTDSQ
ncbi:hypothetical protein Scep_028040 [Stephania cephalantha]|uniref:Uncharacterized protein n=1 Tax=Stephania cephalantha TaxID=152367 RepID=A0AAP0EGJ0_9MAGN